MYKQSNQYNIFVVFMQQMRKNLSKRVNKKQKLLNLLYIRPIHI